MTAKKKAAPASPKSVPAAPAPAPASRHMQRADGKTQTSISMREDLLDQARRAAESEGRSLSNWIEQMLKERFTPASAAAATAAEPGPVRPATPPPTSAKRGRKKA